MNAAARAGKPGLGTQASQALTWFARQLGTGVNAFVHHQKPPPMAGFVLAVTVVFAVVFLWKTYGPSSR